MSVPASWQHFTQENLERARKQREFSVKLRGDMDTLMKACATEMWNQFNCVNNAFTARVQQSKDANANLLAHLQKVQISVFRSLQLSYRVAQKIGTIFCMP